MLLATVLALIAAVLHATWNLRVKASEDRLAMLWAQFVFGGLIAVIVVTAGRWWGDVAWNWVAISGTIHIAYAVLLALAYELGDFSFAYPLARGGGAALAAIGGVVVLGDHLPPLAVVAIAIVTAGLISFVRRGTALPALYAAVTLAVVIGAYTLTDTRGVRSSSVDVGYAFATTIGSATGITIYGLARRWQHRFVAVVRRDPRAIAVNGTLTVLTYGLVLLAARRAPVGYVTALRESSVVLATLAGWRLLKEPAARQRIVSAGVVTAGLILLVIAR